VPLEIGVGWSVEPAVHTPSLRPRFPAACTTMLRPRVALLGVEAVSVARTVKLKGMSLATGSAMPAISPVVGTRLRPVGKAPAEMLQPSGGTPPVALRVKL
jgi:hypothetical protein